MRVKSDDKSDDAPDDDDDDDPRPLFTGIVYI